VTAALILAAGALAGRAQVAGDDPVALVRSYFSTSDESARAAIAERIGSHSQLSLSRLGGWLHAGYPFPDQAPGLQTFQVDIGAGQSRTVALIVPEGYRADRAWPLIYALHPSGVEAAEWARRVERLFGARAREFLIASPEFEQNYIFAKPPFVAEHPAILDAVARRVHVASDRVYPFGYSKGGFAAWFVSLYYPDRVAGAVSVAAGFDVAPGDDGLWKELAPNVAHTPILNVWGENDPLRVHELDGKPGATFAASNRLFEREVRDMGLPITNVEVAGATHVAVAPPAAPLARLIEGRRRQDPSRLAHTFRHLHQASCYWLEGLTWVGDSWGDPPPVPAIGTEGERDDHRIARTLTPLLGRLNGTIEDQSITVTRYHVGDIVVWLGDHTIDWNRPIRLQVDGRVVFKGRVERDVRVALARAQATMDFDSLRFAGVRVDRSGQVSMVTAASMPAPVWRSGELSAVVPAAGAGNPPPAAPANPELEQVLGRAGDAVSRQVRESTTILAEEQCRQSAYEIAPPSFGGTLGGRVCTANRRWKADLSLVLVETPERVRPVVPWLEIRDVLELDGRALPRREARLEGLFLEGRLLARSRAREIVEENTRYNLGPVNRSTNAPTIPLLVLYPPNRERFVFRKAGEQTIDGALTWKVDFREVGRPTLVRAADGSDMPSAGTFWIEPRGGQVVRVAFECGASSETRLTVDYRLHPVFGLTLPVQMVEKALRESDRWVEGRCEYSNFRRFETKARVVFQ
jgi:pimeloyl-ACP methyl ester carboxylesterase